VEPRIGNEDKLHGYQRHRTAKSLVWGKEFKEGVSSATTTCGDPWDGKLVCSNQNLKYEGGSKTGNGPLVRVERGGEKKKISGLIKAGTFQPSVLHRGKKDIRARSRAYKNSGEGRPKNRAKKGPGSPKGQEGRQGTWDSRQPRRKPYQDGP